MPTIPTPDKISLKYITCFKNQSEFENARPNFEEVNWSCIKNQESPDHYRLSRRLSNMYNKDNPPMYKFNDINDVVIKDDKNIYPDASMIVSYNDEDNIKKTFFLEIVWGYSGWEWNTYELVTGEDPDTGENIVEILTGGNHYKVKEITKVPHIIDGDRLQHINDFLLSQDKVTSIEGFDTSNIKAANRAFKRGTPALVKHQNSILGCHLTDFYDENNNLLSPYFGSGNTLSNLVEADELFYNNKIYVNDNNLSPINIPNITHIDKLYYFGAYTSGLQFKMNKLTKLTNTFKLAYFTQPIINLNNIFIEDTLKKVDDFSGMLELACLSGEVNENKNTTILLDLSDSQVNGLINLSNFINYAGPFEMESSKANIEPNSILNIDINFKDTNTINLYNAFNSILRRKNITDYERYPHGQYISNGGFSDLNINFHGKESCIRNLEQSFANNTFPGSNPIKSLPHKDCNDQYIYRNSIFGGPVTYNFSSNNNTSRSQYGQFNGCIFNDTYSFSNIDILDRVEFCNIQINSNNKAFTNIVHNNNYHSGDNLYKIVDFAGSQFSSIVDQNIYIDTMEFRTIENKAFSNIQHRVNPFYNCPNLTDLSGVHLYYKDAVTEVDSINGQQQQRQYIFDFSGCTNLTKTPEIHFTLNYLGGNGTNYVQFKFDNLSNLTDVNLTNYTSGVNTGTTVKNFSFKNCFSIVNIRIGNGANSYKGNIDLSGCYYHDGLNLNTLKDTLLNRYPKVGNAVGGNTTIMESLWNHLDNETKEACNNSGNVTIVVDSSYNP